MTSTDSQKENTQTRQGLELSPLGRQSARELIREEAPKHSNNSQRQDNEEERKEKKNRRSGLFGSYSSRHFVMMPH